jgi:Tfp pilus assembly PilM family ATPase
MATELAERRGIALVDARARLMEADLTAPPLREAVAAPEPVEPDHADEGSRESLSPEQAAALESEMSFEELSAVGSPGALDDDLPAASDADVWAVLDNGVREISGEVRNSLDFHRSQEGGEVSHVVLSGAAEDIPGFAEALQGSLGVEVRPASIGVADGLDSDVAPHRLAVATGLATTEAPQ